MSGEQSNAEDAPFGYTFPPLDQDSTQQPPGPPLLDTNEQFALQNFFDTNFPSDPDVFSSSSLNWQFPIPNFPTAASNMADSRNLQGLGQEHNPASLSNYPTMPGPNTQGSSQDAYNAARILHNQQGFRTSAQVNPQSSLDPALYAGSQNRPQSQHGQNFRYSSNPFFSAAAYIYSQSASPNGFFGNVPVAQMTGSDQRQISQNLSSMPSNQWTDTTSSGPLNFGSDEKFRNSSYAGSAITGPDRDLKDMVAHNFVPDETYPAIHNPRRTPPPSGNRKRRKLSMRSHTPEYDEDDDNVEDDDEESGTVRTQKRRRSRYKDDDGDYGVGSSKKGKGKGKQTSAARGTTGPGSPGGGQNLSIHNDSDPLDGRDSGARENLSEEQKRANHIESERKRRELIKQGFSGINHLVPELRAGGFSKSQMLTEAAKYMRQIRDTNEELKRRLKTGDYG